MHENIAIVHMVTKHNRQKNQFNLITRQLLCTCIYVYGNDANDKKLVHAFALTRLSLFFLLLLKIPFGDLVALFEEKKLPYIDREGENFNEIKVSGSNYSWL